MATPIVPQVIANEAVLQRISVAYNPVWDGVSWVITPADITVQGNGTLTNVGIGESIQVSSISLLATDLPPAGQSALNELYQFIEEAMAAQYT